MRNDPSMVVTRSVQKTGKDYALGSLLVREYCDATADEIGVELDVLLQYVPEYRAFPGNYSHPGDFLIAEVEGRTAGCVGITPAQDGLCEMNRLWVRPEFRRFGVGRKLIEASLHRAGELRYRRMGLDVLSTRRGAIELYLSQGFQVCPTFHDYEFEMVGLERRL